jgi:site-specific recombinase XerD
MQRNLSKILDKLFNKDIVNNSDNTQEQNAENRRNKVVIHTLRHTFGSLLAIDGVPIYTIKKLMNHKDIKMTQRYAKLSPESGRNSIDAIF